MKIAIAPDSYKGSLSAKEVADAIERGIRKCDGNAEVVKIPMADGGEGTVQALVDATGGRIVDVCVSDPLMRRINAFYGILGDNTTAVIEMSAASGLPLLAKDERKPLITTTYGTGELIRNALDRGCRKIIIGIGGSATNDGGQGMAKALGAEFLDSRGCDIGLGGGSLGKLASMDISKLDRRLSGCEIVAACDVDNVLCGENGASHVFGPQKGASADDVEVLDRNLMHYGNMVEDATGMKVLGVKGSGAAGGLGAALLAFLGARLERGIEIVINTVSLEERIRDADLVITGEGMIDFQTAFGKTPCGVAKEAAKFGIPVVAIAGGIGKDADTLYEKGFDSIFSIADKPMTLEESIRDCGRLLEDAAERIMRLVLAVRRRSKPV